MQTTPELTFATTSLEDLSVPYQVEVDRLTGAANLRVPLPLTEGRGGFGPQLALEYGASSGNSPFGLGWSLNGLPAISLNARPALPRYDGQDGYSAGGNELVPILEQQPGGEWRPRINIQGNYRIQFYRSRFEQAFVRYEQWLHSPTGRIYWRSRDTRNVVTIYGRRADDSSRLADPQAPDQVFLWLAEAQYDPFGNAIWYEYALENDAGVDAGLVYEWARIVGGRGFAQRYLKRIYYGNTHPLQPDTAGPAGNRWLFEVVFDYDDHSAAVPGPAPDRAWTVRADPFSNFRPGFEVRTYRLCQRILLFHNFVELDPAGPTLVGAVELAHAHDPTGSTIQAITFRRYRRDPAGGPPVAGALPPLRLSYSTPRVAKAFQAAPVETEENVPTGLSGTRYQWIDLFGEGLPGILTEMDQAWYYKANEGGGRFGPQQRIGEKPSQLAGRFALGDFDRDGNTNLMLLQGRLAGSYELDRAAGLWNAFHPFAALPHLEAAGPHVQWLDMTGDGRSDLMLAHPGRLTWYPALGKAGFAAPQEITVPSGTPVQIEENPDLHYFFADMNGDGLTDLVRIQNGRVEYWPQIGHGRFGEAVLMDNVPLFAPDHEFDAGRLRLVDLDGNGAADVLYLGRGEVHYWRNANGNRLLDGRRITGLPYIDNLASARILDFLGDGTPCLVWSSPLPGQASAIHYLALTGGILPRLLVAVENSLGLETRLEYSTSARHYLRDQQSGQEWRTRLPTHGVVVDRLEFIDHIGGAREVSRYEYHDGLFDGEEGAFQGFALVDEYDDEIQGTGPASAPTCIRTWFHPGAANTSDDLTAEFYALDAGQVFLPPHTFEGQAALEAAEYNEELRALAGVPVRHEIFAVNLAGQRDTHPFQVTQSSYYLRRLQPGLNGQLAAFTFYLSERLTADYEQVSNDPRLAHHLTLETDDYGQVTLEAHAAYARRAGRPIEAMAQQQTTLTIQRHRFTSRDAVGRYETGIPFENQEYEINGLAPGVGGIFRLETLRREVPPLLNGPLAHHQPFAPGPARARLVEWEQSYYWNDALAAARPLGAVGALTRLHHEESACFAETFIAATYGGRVNAAMLQNEGSYLRRAGYWWQRDATHHYENASGFSLLERLERWDGAIVTYAYDAPYYLTLTEVRDSQDNRTRAAIDYYLLAPWRITDANDAISEVLYDPLGITVVSTQQAQILGPAGAAMTYGHDLLAVYQPQPPPTLMDVLTNPSRYIQTAAQFFSYNLFAWLDSRAPPSTLTLIQETLVHDGTGVAPPAGRIQLSLTYLDGFGRELQNKLLVEPGPAVERDANGQIGLEITGLPRLAQAATRWLVSGHIGYNRKQQPVRQYEPFYSAMATYEPDQELATFGVSHEFEYDALNRLVREAFPNGTISRTEYRPWQMRHYDANDTVLDSLYGALRLGLPASHPERRALAQAEAHADTPTITHLDSLGREVRQVEMGEGGITRVTETRLDDRGNVLEIIDPRGLSAFVYGYDMQGRGVYSRSQDAGESWLLPDTLDRPIHQWDGRGVHQRRTFDLLDRPLAVVVDGALGLNHTAEQFVYGDDPAIQQAALRHLRGRLAIHRDQAGVLTVRQYDPEGNVLHTERQLRRDYRGEPDWANPGGVALDPAIYTSRTAFDSLGRAMRQELPDGATRRTTYLRGGGTAEVRVSTADGLVNNQAIFSGSEFNARGQRTRSVLGNGVTVEYQYDPETFLTQRITARRPPLNLNDRPRPLLDVEYTYDPAGNVTYCIDHAQQPTANPAPFLQGLNVSAHQEFTYDAFYQLTEATGRVHQALLQHDYRPGLPHPGGQKGTRHLSLNNGAAVERYSRHYTYDLAGNLQRMRHQGTSQRWTTNFWISPNSNRSLPRDDPAGNPIANPAGRFDANGNCTYLPHLRAIEWSYRNNISHVVLVDRSAAAQPDDAEYYVYGGDGLRVRKVLERLVAGQVVITELIYLDGCEIRRIRRGNQVELERVTSHLNDGANRVALLHRWTVDDNSRETDDVTQPRLHYQLSNHLGSVLLEVDPAGQVITYEEYFPCGGTAFLAGNRMREVDLKVYRYQGKERDDATGFYYFEYRYYASWIGRWLSPDPLGPEDGVNLYLFVQNNPINLVDPDGLQTRQTQRAADVPVRFIPFAELPSFLGADPQQRYYILYSNQEAASTGIGHQNIGSLEELSRAAARISGAEIAIYDPRFVGLAGQRMPSETAEAFLTLADVVDSPSVPSRVTGGGGGEEEEQKKNPPDAATGDKEQNQNVQSENEQEEDDPARVAQKKQDATGLGQRGQGPGGGGQSEQIGRGDQPGSGQGTDKSGTGKIAKGGSGRDPYGVKGGQGDIPVFTEPPVVLPSTPPNQATDQGQRVENPNLLPSEGRIPASPNVTINGTDVNGTLSGDLFGNRNGLPGLRGRPGSSPSADNPRGSASGQRGPGHEQTWADTMARVAGILNFESTRGDPERGQSGGIPGGRGVYNIGAAGPILYTALTLFSFLGGGLVKLVRGVFKGGMRVATKLLTAVVQRGLPALRAALTRTAQFARTLWPKVLEMMTERPARLYYRNNRVLSTVWGNFRERLNRLAHGRSTNPSVFDRFLQQTVGGQWHHGVMAERHLGLVSRVAGWFSTRMARGIEQFAHGSVKLLSPSQHMIADRFARGAPGFVVPWYARFFPPYRTWVGLSPRQRVWGSVATLGAGYGGLKIGEFLSGLLFANDQ